MEDNDYLVDDLEVDVSSPGAEIDPLRIELLHKLAEKPVRIRAVAEARNKETFEHIYARALEFCIENDIWQCWSHVFRLDGFRTDSERAAALREFCTRWIHNTASDSITVQSESAVVENFHITVPSRFAILRRVTTHIKKFVNSSSRPTSGRNRTYFLHDWRELIRALYVLSFYETTDCGRKNFLATHRTARTLFSHVRQPETEMTSEQRKALIRYAINFDLLDVARRLAKKGGTDTKFVARLLDAFVALTEHNDKFLASYVEGRYKRNSIIASTVWGDEFVAHFMDYCVASLLSSGNIPQLAKETSVIHSIVTTAQDKDRIQAHPLFNELQRHAHIVFRTFDKSLLQERTEADFAFYRFYGFLDHVHIDLARKLSCDLFLLPPDVIFSTDCLIALSRALLDQGDVCSPAYLEAEKLGFLREIEGERADNGTIALPAPAMLARAGKHITNHFRSLIVNPQNKHFCRDPREIFWPVDGGLMVHSVYVHPCAVSQRVLSRTMHPNYENVDYAFPARALQADGKLVVLKDTDAAAAVHFSPTERPNSYLRTGFTLRNFVGAHNHDYQVHRACFPNGVFLPCGNLGYHKSIAYKDELTIVAAALDRSIRHQDEKTLLSFSTA